MKNLASANHALTLLRAGRYAEADAELTAAIEQSGAGVRRIQHELHELDATLAAAWWDEWSARAGFFLAGGVVVALLLWAAL